MLSDLLIARSAMGRAGPDLTRHAAMQCSFARFRSNLSKLFMRVIGQATAGDAS